MFAKNEISTIKAGKKPCKLLLSANKNVELFADKSGLRSDDIGKRYENGHSLAHLRWLWMPSHGENCDYFGW